ncbi:hypothetical protein [Halobacillus litoralis]|uniref:rolling circle replication-associated protein n=1 Tax=Halobacillus litoralis TaxID=45668 RepID=UPI001CD5369B|nr:hypothetical protein [Halobacillus litoralis]MCA1022133.1 hypothetical protein [Halobacillus litoralis]
MYTSAIISNNFIEIKQQTTPPFVPNSCGGGRKKSLYYTSEQNERNVKSSINRARQQIRRLLECNFSEGYTFLTLTFNEDSNHNIRDYDQCYKSFCDFKKRLAYFLSKQGNCSFKYIGVAEFQEKRAGAIHYHLICNLYYLSKQDLSKLWGNGWVDIKHIKSSPADNEKIANYMKKGIADQRLQQKKKYFRSQGLSEPEYITIENEYEFMQALNNSSCSHLNSESYYSPMYGEVILSTYYSNNAKELKSHA